MMAADEKRTAQGVLTGDERTLTPNRRRALAENSVAHAARTLLKSVTPENLVAILDSAHRNIAAQIQLAAQIEDSDDHIAGTLALRRSAVLRLDVQLTAGNPDDPASTRAAELAEKITEQPWFYHAREWLLRGVWHQWAAVEMLYERTGGQATSGTPNSGGGGAGTTRRSLWMPSGFRAVEPERWYFDEVGNPGLYQHLQRISAQHVIEPVAGNFLVAAFGAVHGQPGRYAPMRPVAKLWYIFSVLGLTGWGEAIDKWFAPFLAVQYQQGLSSATVETLADDLLLLAAQKLAMLPEGTSLEMHDVPDQSPHQAAQDFYRRAVSRYLVGQESSQMVTAGQETGATLQGEVRDDIRDRDALLLDAALNETFFTPWCQWNFGPGVAAPRVSHVIHEALDPEQRGRVFKGAQEIGLAITRRQVYAELNIDEPDEGDELLVAPAAQTTFDANAVDNVAFEKRMLELIGQGQMTREMLVNLLDVQEMIRRVGLPLYNLGKGADAEPWLPLIAPMGQEVSGDIKRDDEGDIVGGDVEEQLPGFGGLGLDWSPTDNRQDAKSAEDAKDFEASDTGIAEQAKDATLTGIQITSLQELLQAVSDGTQSAEVVTLIITEAYPGIAPETIQAMVAEAVRFGEENRQDARSAKDAEGETSNALRATRYSKLSYPELLQLAVTRPDLVRYVGGRNFLVRQGALTGNEAGSRKPEAGSHGLQASSLKLTASSSMFEGHLAAVRQAAEGCSSAEQLRAELDKLSFDTDQLAEAIHAFTFGAYCAGRLDTAEQATAKTPRAPRTQSSRVSSLGALGAWAVNVCAGGDDLQRKAFAAALEMMAQRTDLLTKEQFLKLEGMNRARAWTVARQAEQQILQDLYDATSEVLGQGQSYREFLDSLDAIMEKRGWAGLEPWHARIVYDQNVAMAYTTGRTQQAKDAGIKHWRKLPSESRNPRPEHARFDGQIFTFAQMSPPPWDFGCGCGWEVVFEDEVDRRRLATETPNFGGQEFQFDASDYFKGV